MLDSAWDLIDGNVAHEIEVLNYSNQVNVIEALVRFLLHHAGPQADDCPIFPDEDALKEIHRTGTLFLLAKPGQYRSGPVYIRKRDGTLVHTPPPADQVPNWMVDFFQRLGTLWPNAGSIEVAAFSLWMLNWVHPFKNGNGRSARAFCYACICLKFGFVLPGAPTVIDQIMNDRDEYQTALKVADVKFEQTGEPDLSTMITFLGRLLINQLRSVPPQT
ncbi:MAG TPA: Fic family protein [Allosphingosinicella sp.]|nr:Fic family protein [Allosphingosinicella sp.]